MATKTPIQDSLTLKELIRGVHQQLIESQLEREASGQEALFEVEKLQLEVNFVITHTSDAKAGLGFGFKLLPIIGGDVGASKKYEQQEVHKITLTLKAKPPKKRVSGVRSMPLGEDPGGHGSTGY